MKIEIVHSRLVSLAESVSVQLATAAPTTQKAKKRKKI